MLQVILVIENKDDQDYVEDVFERYRVRLYRRAFGILKHESDAEDCVQDVIVVLIDHLQEYQKYSDVHKTKFLFVCCRNIAINKYLQKKRQNQFQISTTQIETGATIDLEDYDSNLEKTIVFRETQNNISRAIDSMDSKYGDLLFFRYICNIKNNDIAKILVLPVNTVNVRLSRARAQLADIFTKEEV